MRATIFVLFLLQVTVEEPLLRVVPTIDHLRQWCAAEGSYDACTQFIAYRLEARCVPDGQQGWSMDAAARFRPWIFLYNLRQLSHEREHIGDVQRSAEELVAGLEHLRFASAEECEARALTERAAFGAAMRNFATASNAKRHPQ